MKRQIVKEKKNKTEVIFLVVTVGSVSTKYIFWLVLLNGEQSKLGEMHISTTKVFSV